MAGARHTWVIDKVGVLTVLAFTAVYVAAVVIAGAPLAYAGVMLFIGAVALAVKIYQRARDNREALLFFDYMNEQTVWDQERYLNGAE